MNDATHDQGTALVMASLVMGAHLAEILTTQVMINSGKVEEIYDGIADMVQAGGTTLAVSVDGRLGPCFAAMRENAKRQEARRLGQA